MRSEIRLEFEERTDKDGKKYLFCKPNLPCSLDLREVALFLWSEEDGSTMSIARTRNNHNRGREGNENSRYGNDSERDE